jgi:hypothetical protein
MRTGTKNADLLVLESDWGEDLVDNGRTRPFLEGLASALGILVGCRTFHTGCDLQHWLHQIFSARSKPRMAYISSHGDGRFLHRHHLEMRGSIFAACSPLLPGARGRSMAGVGSCWVPAKSDGTSTRSWRQPGDGWTGLTGTRSRSPGANPR